MNDFDPDGTPGAAEAPTGNLLLNLMDVDESMPSFQALPAGIYDCEVLEVGYAPSAAGNPMITWQFQVLSEEPSLKNRRLFYHTVLNKPAGLARLKRLLVRILPEVDLASFDPDKFALEGTAIGKRCKVKISTRPDDRDKTKKRNDVVDVMAAAETADFIDEIK